MEKNLQQKINHVITSLLKSKAGRNFTYGDLELKSILAFNFIMSLFEDEIIQAEYRKEDIILLVLLYWENNNEKIECRIREVLYEPVENHFFIHYTKVIGRNDAYEFIFEAVFQALKNNFILTEALRDLHKKAVRGMRICPQIPMNEGRNKFGLLYAINAVNMSKDPAIANFSLNMN